MEGFFSGNEERLREATLLFGRADEGVAKGLGASEDFSELKLKEAHKLRTSC